MTDKTRSGCPIATALDILGDKWTLIVVRDLFTGKNRYSDFLTSPEGITTNILADRLARMERWGLIDKAPYQERPVRHEYRLTARGRALKPTLQEICRWSNAEFPHTWQPPEWFMQPEATAPEQ